LICNSENNEPEESSRYLKGMTTGPDDEDFGGKDSPFGKLRLRYFLRKIAVNVQGRRWELARRVVNEMQAEAEASPDEVTDDTFICSISSVDQRVAGHLEEIGIETVGQLKVALRDETFRVSGIGEVWMRQLKEVPGCSENNPG
jgi:hypothetical protein